MAFTPTLNLKNVPGDSEPHDTESPSLDKAVEVGEDPVEGVQDGDTTPALSEQTEGQPLVTFIDPLGTRWDFPYASAKTWDVSHPRYPYHVHH